MKKLFEDKNYLSNKNDLLTISIKFQSKVCYVFPLITFLFPSSSSHSGCFRLPPQLLINVLTLSSKPMLLQLLYLDRSKIIQSIQINFLKSIKIIIKMKD